MKGDIYYNVHSGDKYEIISTDYGLVRVRNLDSGYSCHIQMSNLVSEAVYNSPLYQELL